MAIERYVVTALPYSVDPRERFHVSLYIAPRLEPTPSESELRRFPLFAAWTDRLAGAEIVLADQTGPLHTKLASATTPGLWQQAFPADTPVRSRTRPPWTERKWRSFSTRLAEQAAKGIHALSTFASPVETPLPSASPLVAVLLAVAREHKLWDGRGEYDETAVTRVLDRLVESPRELAALMRAGGRDAVYALLGEIHRARRFYERPESMQPFQARPTPGATRPRIEPPRPDFHERLSLVNDHPDLLRALGLVLDLQAKMFHALGSAALAGDRKIDPWVLEHPLCIVGFGDTRRGAEKTGVESDGLVEVGDPDMDMETLHAASFASVEGESQAVPGEHWAPPQQFSVM